MRILSVGFYTASRGEDSISQGWISFLFEGRDNRGYRYTYVDYSLGIATEGIVILEKREGTVEEKLNDLLREVEKAEGVCIRGHIAQIRVDGRICLLEEDNLVWYPRGLASYEC